MTAVDRNSKHQGTNWIRREKRLAIYLRDGLACAYCGDGVEDGATLTLDHLMPHSEGGSNHSQNLLTSCMRCNSHRGIRDWALFASAVAEYVGTLAETIRQHILSTTLRPLDVDAAKQLIARRGSWAQCLENVPTH